MPPLFRYLLIFSDKLVGLNSNAYLFGLMLLSACFYLLSAPQEFIIHQLNHLKMKRLLLLSCIAFFAISCNTDADKSDGKTAAASSDVKYDYAYTLDEPYKNWQPGDQQHVVTVQKSLKAWEAGDLEACMVPFADSVDIRFDGFRQKFSKDSLKTFLAAGRAGLSSVSIKMHDWESVISSDKKEQWVTLWYDETATDKAGKSETISMVDDVRIVDGKVTVLDQKIQRHPAKK